jgi:hypothetical protein
MTEAFERIILVYESLARKAKQAFERSGDIMFHTQYILYTIYLYTIYIEELDKL